MMLERSEVFPLIFSTHIYGYVVSGIWLRTTEIMREETCCHHFIGYSFQLQGIFYIQNPTDGETKYYGLCYTNIGLKWNEKYLDRSTMRDRSIDSLHHVWMLQTISVTFN